MKCGGDELAPRDLIKALTSETVCRNGLIDLFFKAVMRAEIRFISRYAPQRSHEERLTGNLVSEIDNSIYLIKDEFKDLSVKYYSEMKEIDFFYFDLSKGGKIEKDTGADLGFVLIVDLPDYPFTVKSFVLQAKKINNKVQIDSNQYKTLSNLNEENCGYLFYDMNFTTLSSPMVLRIKDYPLEDKCEESKKNKTKSFYLDLNDIYRGEPLSFFLISDFLNKKYGKQHNSLEGALDYFNKLCGDNPNEDSLQFNGRVGIVCLGKKINYNISHNESFRISI
ncbi:MAG: hypothetical protein BWK75_06265 [Candidatus Altiarchaeales archaeon A3]|nr:MAG: hypothetical protein BWK75_06265 [Candidatus Altiarchaeales archaeon A3]